MRLDKIALAVIATLCFVLAACANWSSLSPDQQSAMIAAGLRTVVKPECVRLDYLVDEGVHPETALDVIGLCEEAVEDVIVAVEAGFAEDPAIFCPRIAEKADDCAFVISTSDPIQHARNVASCERVINAAALFCTIALTQPEGPAEPGA